MAQMTDVVVTPQQRRALRAYFKEFRSGPHEFMPTKEGMVSDQWIAKGKPFCWHIAEVSADVIVLLDSSYGWIAALRGNEVSGASTESIVTPEIAILDKHYFSTSKYIWR